MGSIKGILNQRGQAYVDVIITPSYLYRKAVGEAKFTDRKNQLGLSPQFQYKGKALIDTGATVSSIDIEVPKKLKLITKGSVPVHTPKGNDNYEHFDIDLYITMGTKLSLLQNKIVIASTLKPQGIDMLIGTDIIRLGTLIFEKGKYFSFEI